MHSKKYILIKPAALGEQRWTGKVHRYLKNMENKHLALGIIDITAQEIIRSRNEEMSFTDLSQYWCRAGWQKQ